jgi:hypothetical protein
MRLPLIAFLMALFSLAPVAAAEPDANTMRCTAIRDSAMCAARPDCWYDAAEGKGCLKGPRPAEDVCAVHGSQSICNASALGCSWDTSDNKCVSKAN